MESVLKALAAILAFAATIALAGGAHAAEPVLVVGGPGNQTAPSIWGTKLAYLDDLSGAPDLYVRDLVAGVSIRITDDPIAQGAPDLNLGLVAWRDPGVVRLADAARATPVLAIPAAGTGRVALSPLLVAWEQDAPGGSDVAWQKLDGSASTVVAAQGRQHAVAAAQGWVAWADDATGAVHVVDASSWPQPSADRIAFTGVAADLSLYVDPASLTPLVAVMTPGAAGTEIAVVDVAGVEHARLTAPGQKVDPHLFGEWVGFEDVSVGVSQVVIWNWRTNRLFVPAPNGTPQVLHDLSVDQGVLRVAWADQMVTDFDIYMLSTALPLPEPTPPPAVPARCDDPAATVLADFTVTRDKAKATAGGTRFTADVPTPVLACVDATGVSSGWVAVGSQVVAGAGDFNPGVAHLEARVTVAGGDGRAGAVIAGKQGASLHVRVLADPVGGGNGGSPEATCDSASGHCPQVPFGLVPDGASGCATGGTGGGLAALLVGALFALPARRRRARR